MKMNYGDEMSGKTLIAVGGPAGSGKTTYAKYISEKLGLPYTSAGEVFRKLARQKGLSLVELNLEAEKNPEIDFLIDRLTLKNALKGNMVIEGHLVPWVVKEYADLIFYFNAPLEVRVKRIAAREGRDWREVLVETSKREYSHAVRFKRYYGMDLTDLSIFDYVIDTSKTDVDGVKSIINNILRVRLGVQ